MKKFLIFMFFASSIYMLNAASNPSSNRPSLQVTETDGSPIGFPRAIKFPVNSVTDNGDGTFSISFSSAVLILQSGSTSYIQNRDTLQEGATMYISSGTIGFLNSSRLVIISTVTGQIGLTQGIAPSGVDLKQILWADTASNWLKFNPNNTDAFYFVGSSGTVVVGNAAYFSATGAIKDAGFPPFSSASARANGLVNIAGQYALPYYSVTGSSNAVSGSSNILWDGASLTLNTIFIANSTFTITNISSSTFTNVSSITVTSDNVSSGIAFDLRTSTITAAKISVSSLTVSGGSVGQATCWKSNQTIGYCSSAVGIGGDCTCN